METIQNLEKDTHQTKAIGISLTLYAIILASLYLIKIVYEPKVEILEMGVDLNYGVDLVGSGNIQTTNKANISKNNYDVKPEASKSVTKPTPIKSSPPKPVAAAVKTPPAPSNVLTADEDSKVTVKKPTETTKPVSKPSTEVKANTKTTTAPVTAPSTPQRTVDNGSLFKKPTGSSGSNGTTGTKSGVGGNNNGDGKPGEVGDKGDPRGTLDGKSLYGNPGKGGGSGASVSISGWKNRGPLNITKDNSSETGRIVFKVIIDETGDIISISVSETSVSPSVTNYYKSQVTQKLKSNLIPVGTPNTRSPGTITINITRGA